MLMVFVWFEEWSLKTTQYTCLTGDSQLIWSGRQINRLTYRILILHRIYILAKLLKFKIFFQVTLNFICLKYFTKFLLFA